MQVWPKERLMLHGSHRIVRLIGDRLQALAHSVSVGSEWLMWASDDLPKNRRLAQSFSSPCQEDAKFASKLQYYFITESSPIYSIEVE